MDYLDLGEIPAGPSLFSELRSCVKVEVDVLGSPSVISLMISVDVKRH